MMLLRIAAALSVASVALADPRIILHDDLMRTADKFSEPGVISYSQILLDVPRNQIFVGARDYLFKLSSDHLSKLASAAWSAPHDTVQLCQDKGQSERNCHNYIKVLLSYKGKLFTCGTNAFSPECTWREMENPNRAIKWLNGKAMSPPSPSTNNTALFSDEGWYFAGSTTDFTGADSAIIKGKIFKDDLFRPIQSKDQSERVQVRTNQFDSKWLNDPQFVGSFEHGPFVYLLFRETAVEYINCGKAIYSRIARVCKNDDGHGKLLKSWSTFVKARLNCSIPGEYPFYFDNIQGMTFLPEKDMIYATFTTPSNSIPGSAICSFNMTAVLHAFDGPFKDQAGHNSTWERRIDKQHSDRHTKCSNGSSTRGTYFFSKYQLMDFAVQPTTLKPVYNSRLETLTHIAADIVPTKLYKETTILFVANTDGLIKKISVISRIQEACVLEIWKPFPNNIIQPIYSLKFGKNSLYVGTEDSVMRVDRSYCWRHKSRTSCVNSMDPYCGWNDHQENCTTAPNGDPDSLHWAQDATQCPFLDHPVDGGWSAWSSWSSCQKGGKDDEKDSCLCSTRTCSNPPPSNGGSTCEGYSVRVANCTVHGGWTPWSSWSACSQTCGMAVKTRTRTCTNPSPDHGGRVCVGSPVSENYCINIPACPKLLPVQDGGWSSWSRWGECSSKCGGGFRVRTRECNNPPPQDGQDCHGCRLDYQVCNNHTCLDAQRSMWTPWFPKENGSQRRYRYICKARVPDPSDIVIEQGKHEERNCDSRGICNGPRNGDGGWSEWSSWSPCSVDCGEGKQYRLRTCEGRPGSCNGIDKAWKSCNMNKCQSEWGCWSDWTECSVSCGTGIRRRNRECLFLRGVGGPRASEGCTGQATSEELCTMSDCDSALLGWRSWTRWSSCEGGNRYRTRTCHDPTLCKGTDKEEMGCALESLDRDHAGVSMKVVLVSCVTTFVFGCGATIGLWLLCNFKKRPRIPGSPHYISSKQNPYVTVPMKEICSPKRTPSIRSSGYGSGTTPKIFSNSKNGSDYESMTIKRNSHGLSNGHARSDLEQDKFF